jgi:hypothetical protein
MKNLLFVFLITLCLSIAVVAQSVMLGSFTAGQAGQKVIEKAFTRNEVVEFTEIKVSQKAVTPGKPFDTEDEWLKEVFLKVKNISGKPIVYLAVNVNFPETRATGSMMSYPVVFGQRPGSKSKFAKQHDPIFLQPGDTLEVPLDQHYAKIKPFVEERSPIANIRDLELEIGFVIFADNTAWTAGAFLRQDPNNADHYINVGQNPPQ